MAQENMMSVEFTADEIKSIEEAIKTIAVIMVVKGRSLTPDERKLYGRVKYEKEIWVTKVKGHMDKHPDRIPQYVDKAEYDRDYAAHCLLNTWSNLIEQQFNLMEDTNRLLGYDLDESSLMFYRDVKTAAKNNAAGARTIFDDLKQQFPGNKGKKPAIPTTEK